MTDKKQKKFKFLCLLYFALFITIGIPVALTHAFSPPSFDALRIPAYLRDLRFPWPLSFDIYHLIIVTLSLIGSINILGITFYPRWKSIAKISSFFGSFLLLSILVFFASSLTMRANIQTALIYGSYVLFFLIVDLLTFLALR